MKKTYLRHCPTMKTFLMFRFDPKIVKYKFIKSQHPLLRYSVHLSDKFSVFGVATPCRPYNYVPSIRCYGVRSTPCRSCAFEQCELKKRAYRRKPTERHIVLPTRYFSSKTSVAIGIVFRTRLNLKDIFGRGGATPRSGSLDTCFIL